MVPLVILSHTESTTHFIDHFFREHLNLSRFSSVALL